ncbi:hypothetical protein INT43_002261 [Umbelopsis isabellina]|uniref:Retrograde transport protein Dsl1 C-terminal domain-containing protein n=1 Tax=Mortierella isabellina TaxID=91625 RepID=A0A8H7Q686_MORIS|nr:hypothetical protein INT43_002261 [Umbelopsis isabellina]
MADVFVQSIINDANISSPNPAASLNREELNALLDAIDTKTKTLEHAVFDTVKQSSDIFLDSWITSQSTKADVQVLLQDLDAVQREVYNEDNGIQMVVKSSLAEYNDVVNQVSNNQNIIDSLEALVPIVDQLKHVDSQLTAGYLVETRRLLEELENSIFENFHSPQWDSVHAIHVIRRTIEITKSGLIEALEDCIRNSITFDIQSPAVAETMEAGNTFKMNVKYQSVYKSRKSSKNEGIPITLSEVFTCISQLGSLEAHIQPIKRDIYRHIIVPLLEHTQQPWNVDVHQLNEGLATLELKSTGKEEDLELDPVTTVGNLDIIFDFFYKYLFGNATQSRSQNLLFGNMVVPGTFDLLITHTLRPSVPSSVEKLNEYAEVAHRVQALEQKLESYNFMANQDEAALSQFVGNIDHYFSLKLKGKILVNARRVILRKIYDAELAEDGVNGARNYYVTQTPRLLLVLVNDTIGTAQKIAEEHPTSSDEMWNTITELVDLYRALMPTYHGETYTSNYNNAMLFRNDCYWLAAHLTELSKANPQNEKILETSAQKLRQLGGVWYELTVGRIVTQINMILDRTDGFTTISQDPRMPDIVGQAISDAVDTALRFSAIVQGALDDDLFLQTMTHVANVLVGRLISDIEKMHDIGEEESHLIARSLNGTMSLINVFSRPDGPDATDAVVSERVKDWKKFWIIRNMLEMSFKDIMELFRDGELQCFETNELCELLCALFADTELRQNNLKEIQRGYRSQHQIQSFSRGVQPEPAQEDEAMDEDNGWEPFDDNDDVQTEDTTWKQVDNSKQEKASQQRHAWEPLEEPMDEDHQDDETGWDDDPIVHHEEQKQESTAVRETVYDPEHIDDDESGWEVDDPIIHHDEEAEHGMPADKVAADSKHVHDNETAMVDEPMPQHQDQVEELPLEHATPDDLKHASEEESGWEVEKPIGDRQNHGKGSVQVKEGLVDAEDLHDEPIDNDTEEEEPGWEVDEPIIHHNHAQESGREPDRSADPQGPEKQSSREIDEAVTHNDLHQDEAGWEVDEPIIHHYHVEESGKEMDGPAGHQGSEEESGWEVDEPVTHHDHDQDEAGWDVDESVTHHDQDKTGREVEEPVTHQEQDEPGWEVDEPIVHHDPEEDHGWDIDEPVLPDKHEVDSGWEVDEPVVHHEQEASDWEPFDHTMEEVSQPRPHVPPKQGSSSSSLSGMLDNLNRTSSPRPRASLGASPTSVNNFRQSSPRPREESFGNLFSGISRGSPSPRPVSPNQRSNSSGRDSPFTSLLGNLIGATPSPNPEQQEARQPISSLGLPSLDVLNYASNRIAGEFTNVVGNMIGAAPARQSHSPATPDLVTARPKYRNQPSNNSSEDRPSSRLDFMSHHIDEANDKKADGEEEGWDW